MITNDAGTHKLMINRETGERYLKILDEDELEIVKQSERESDASAIINSHMSAEEQLEALTQLGYDLEECLELALGE